MRIEVLALSASFKDGKTVPAGLAARVGAVAVTFKEQFLCGFFVCCLHETS